MIYTSTLEIYKFKQNEDNNKKIEIDNIEN